MFGAIALLGLATGCTAPWTAGISTADGRRTVTIVNYNVQNLFDANDDGGEYREFTQAGGWNYDAYYARLIRLGRVLTEMVPSRPDVIVLEEVENRGVIADLQRDFLRGRRVVVMSPARHSVIQVAVLTRLPVRAARIHRATAVAVQPGEVPRPPVTIWIDRDMLEVDLATRSGPLRLIACHWKSQSGGERETEARRLEAAALLRNLLADTVRQSDDGPPHVAARESPAPAPLRVGVPVTLVIGDLNEDVQEFGQHGGVWPTALMPERSDDNGLSLVVTPDIDAAGASEGRVTLFSPWFQSAEAGSYRHAGRWERLDQGLLLPAPDTRAGATLEVVSNQDLLDARGTPRRYDSRSGSGYSDHLPVVVRVHWDRP